MSSLRGKIFPCAQGCGRDDFETSALRDSHQKRCSGVAGEELASESDAAEEQQSGARKRKSVAAAEDEEEEQSVEAATLDDLLNELITLNKRVNSLARNMRIIKRRTPKLKSAAELHQAELKRGFYTSAVTRPDVPENGLKEREYVPESAPVEVVE